MEAKKVLLVILDGWGHGPKPEVSAIAKANTPFVDSLYKKYPNAELVTFGEEVGLPEGQMGNSEVGHLNIGAGRIVYQELARINKSIRDEDLHKNEKLLAALNRAKKESKAVHFMGLVSDGGVHSHINHLKALCDIAEDNGNEQVFIHAFMDGRDTAPKSGKAFLNELFDHIADQKATVASVIGRYYAMDRDKRWERIKLAYDLMVKAEGEASKDALATIAERYDGGETDEFLKPITCVNEDNEPIATVKDGDVLICFNFRTDRPREISQVLTQEDMPDHDMKKLDVHYVTMTRYDERFQNVHILFEKEDIKNTLGEVLSRAGKTQVRIAETEKYPHVTFFFSGGKESAFERERRLLVASPKVATYDLKPEMSANELTKAIIEDITKHQPDFICLNYANADMVGHTGVFDAAIKAVESVDTNLQQLIETGLQYSYEAIVIADHGNSDYMINDDGSPHTAHTKNMVPIIYIGQDTNIRDGKLADVAPTILNLMGVKRPTDMTGDVLIDA